MKVIDSKELEERYGLTATELDVWEKDATCGVFYGEPRGEVVIGRPSMFGEEPGRVV